MATEWFTNVMAEQVSSCTTTCTTASVTYENDNGQTITITAEQEGQDGNFCITGDPSQTVEEVVDDWNSNNPNQQVVITEGASALFQQDEVCLTGGACETVCDGDAFNTKEDAEVLKGLFIGRMAHQQYRDAHNIKQLKMWDIL